MSLEQHDQIRVRLFGLSIPVVRSNLAIYPHELEPTADGVDLVARRSSSASGASRWSPRSQRPWSR